jgi:hypothetical protein
LMSSRPKKTADELSEMIRAQIRRHPECNQIAGVKVIRKMNPTLSPNWDPMWKCKGAKVVPAVASRIAMKIQGQFDLA